MSGSSRLTETSSTLGLDDATSSFSVELVLASRALRWEGIGSSSSAEVCDCCLRASSGVGDEATPAVCGEEAGTDLPDGLVAYERNVIGAATLEADREVTAVSLGAAMSREVKAEIMMSNIATQQRKVSIAGNNDCRVSQSS